MVHYFNFSVNKEGKLSLDSSSSSAARPSCAIMGNWCNFFDAFNSEPKPCQCTDSCLGAWTGSSWATAAWSSDFDVNGCYSFVSSYFSRAGCCTHRSVRGRLHAVCFNEHAAAGSSDCFRT